MSIIDLSHYQGSIDWEQAQKVVDLAIIRTSCGTLPIDPEFKGYVQGCKQYGIPFGHMHYSLYRNAKEALAEADRFISLIDPEAKFLVVDVRDAVQKHTGVSLNTQLFIDHVQNSTGKRVGLHSNNYYYQVTGLSRVKADFLWIARYSECKENGRRPDIPCELWQYTDEGTVPGISGPVKLNALNGSWTLNDFIAPYRIGFAVAEGANTFCIQSGRYPTKGAMEHAMERLLQGGYLHDAEGEPFSSTCIGWRFVSGKYDTQSEAVEAATRAIQAGKLPYATIKGTSESPVG
ncbi:MAG: glycoside hydrolase family 25 protein [Lysinibacillus sp.]